MTTHELARIFDHLREGFASGLTRSATDDFTELAAAFRELPDQPIRQLVKQMSDKQTRGGRADSKKADLTEVLTLIEAVRNGDRAAEEAQSIIESLKGPQLKAILGHYQQDQKGSLSLLRDRIMKEVCVAEAPSAAGELNSLNEELAVADDQPATPVQEPSAEDLELTEEGFKLYQRVRNNRELSNEEMRAALEPIRNYPPSVIEAITRRAGFTPLESTDEMIEQLRDVIASVRAGQIKEEEMTVSGQ